MLVFRRRNKSRASLFCEFQFATASTISYAWWDYMAKVFEMSDIFTIEFPWSRWTILQMNWWEPVFNVHQVEPPRFQLNKFSCLIVYVKFAFEDTQRSNSSVIENLKDQWQTQILNVLEKTWSISQHCSQQTSFLIKMPFVFVFRKRLQDVLIKTNIFALVISLQNVCIPLG